MTQRLLRTAQLWLVVLTLLLTDRWTAMRARADRDGDRAATVADGPPARDARSR